MNSPTSSMDVIYQKLAAEMDGLLKRIDEFEDFVGESGKKLALQADLLQEAGSRYGRAVQEFTEEAKTELADYFENRAKVVASEQAALLRETVLACIKAESGRALLPCRAIIRKAQTGWIVAHGLTAFCASVLTALLIRFSG